MEVYRSQIQLEEYLKVCESVSLTVLEAFKEPDDEEENFRTLSET